MGDFHFCSGFLINFALHTSDRVFSGFELASRHSPVMLTVIVAHAMIAIAVVLDRCEYANGRHGFVRTI